MTKILPSALDNFDMVMHDLVSHNTAPQDYDVPLALFLDYDGTLTPIVAQPQDAIIEESTRQTVLRLSCKCPTAIVSGRGKSEVKDLMRVGDATTCSQKRVGEKSNPLLGQLYFAGSHGFDIEGPNGFTCMVAKEYTPLLGTVYDALRSSDIANIEGIIIEDKVFSLSIHYRKVKSQQDIDRITEAVLGAVQNNPKLVLTTGKKVFEVRPNVAWNKGRATLMLLDTYEKELMNVKATTTTAATTTTTTEPVNSPHIKGIFLGDDNTDEDAFIALRDSGRGLGVLVSDATERHSTSFAKYSLRNTEEVKVFLSRLEESLNNNTTTFASI